MARKKTTFKNVLDDQEFFDPYSSDVWIRCKGNWGLHKSSGQVDYFESEEIVEIDQGE